MPAANIKLLHLVKLSYASSTAPSGILRREYSSTKSLQSSIGTALITTAAV